MDDTLDAQIRTLNAELEYQRQLTAAVIASFSDFSQLARENASLRQQLTANRQETRVQHQDPEELMEAADVATGVNHATSRWAEQPNSVATSGLARSLVRGARQSVSRTARRSEFRPRSRAGVFD